MNTDNLACLCAVLLCILKMLSSRFFLPQMLFISSTERKDKSTTCEKHMNVGMGIRVCVCAERDLENLCDRQYDKN